MATDYTYLYDEYPEVISADQLYRICHISKRKAKWLLEHGYIPCEDSGKKTRRYKIRLNDVIDYLLTLEAAPDLVATPVGAFNVKRKQLNPVAQICQKEFQRFLYNIWTDEADILRISDVQVLLGYSAGTIRQWILRKELRSTRLPCGIQVTAKEWLIDFITVRSHPAVLDGFVTLYRKAYQKLGLFGSEHCFGDRAEQDYTAKVLVLSPDTLKESFWSQENQLWYAHDGFGCSPHAIGRSVRCTCLGDGEMTRWNRDEFIGVLDEQFLPEWAQETLAELTAPRQEKTTTGEMTLE